MAGTDDWVNLAMSDDLMVLELLIRLKHATVTPSTTLRWGVRLPRSLSNSKEADSAKDARSSPTNPFSWSGGRGGADSSPSAVGEGYEATTSRGDTASSVAGARSKGLPTDDRIKGGAKGQRKKKTFTQLKEEETVLLNERIYLEKEIASRRATFKEHRTENENLKRAKLDLEEGSYNHIHLILNSDLTKRDKMLCAQDNVFVLPDLNMMPSEG